MPFQVQVVGLLAEIPSNQRWPSSDLAGSRSTRVDMNYGSSGVSADGNRRLPPRRDAVSGVHQRCERQLQGGRDAPRQRYYELSALARLGGGHHVRRIAGGLWLGAELVKSFSGKGLVPDSVALDPVFLAAVVFGAAATVMLPTRFSSPISTTHAITGALVGTGLLARAGNVTWWKLGARPSSCRS